MSFISPNDSAPLRISFVIVGGGKLPSSRTWNNVSGATDVRSFVLISGIAGLSAAYTLCMAGHRVRVLEKASELGYSSCGIRVPPNMSKILKKWVGSEELEKVAVLNTATPCIDST